MIRLRILGAPDLRGDDAGEMRGVLTQPRLVGLLSYLTLARPRGFHRRDSLVALFWPELSQEGARNALRQTVHRLRTALGEGVVVNRGAEEVGVDPARLWCDAVRFDDAVDVGDSTDAVDLYRGDLLPGFYVSDAPEFERWLEGERDRLRQRAATVAWGLAERAAAKNEAVTTAHWARWAAALTPDDEGSLRRCLRLLLQVGDRAGAVRAYDLFAKRLKEDYASEPSPQTRAMLATPPATESVAAARPDGAAPSSPAGPPTPASAPAAPAVTSAVMTTRTADAPDTAPVAPPRAGTTAPRRRWWAALAIAPVAAALVIGWVRTRAHTTGGDIQALAVFPFTVRGSEELDFLREGMVDLLSAKLDGAADLRSIDPRATIAATRNDMPAPEPRRASTVASRLGARWFVLGDVVEIAGRVTLNAVLYRAPEPSRPVVSRSVEGEVGRLAELVDDLAGQLLAGQTRGRDTTLTRLASLTTHSLPALKAYLAGEQALRAGRDVQADALFQEAVDLDSTFALARYRLAIITVWVPRGDAVALAAEAARHADRLTPLARDLLIAYRAYRQAAADAAERLYRQITASHPDNVEAWTMLGETWFHFNPYRGRFQAEAEGAFRRAMALDSINPHAIVHLARLAAFEGRRASLDSLVGRFLQLYPDAERGLELRALQAFATRDSVESSRVVSVALAETNDVQLNSVWEAAVLWTQNWVAASQLARANLSGRDPMWLNHWRRWVTEIPIARGQVTTAGMRDASAIPVDDGWLLESRALAAADPFFNLPLRHVAAIRGSIERSRSYPVQPYLMGESNEAVGTAFRQYLLGLLSARLGDTVRARRVLGELAISGDTLLERVAQNLADGLSAEISRTSGNPAAALAPLERISKGVLGAQRLLAHWSTRERFLLADVLVALGRDEEALPWYASFRSYYDLVYMAPAHFRQAEIYERMGNAERARFHYGRFIDLWKDCDPELRPLVDRARQALERLRTGP